MSARAGMTDLIVRLRELTETGATDYTVNAVQYWTDDQLQNILDEHRRRLVGIELLQVPTYEDGANVYKTFQIPLAVAKAVEGKAGGSSVFRIYDSTGATITNTAYTVSERSLEITFTADQAGEVRYWDGYTYDLNGASASVWVRKVAHTSGAYDFQADGHRFDRSQLHKHALEMVQSIGLQAGIRATRMIRTDLVGSPDRENF